MSAHDKTGSRPAFVKSDPPEKFESGPHNINFDASGISMSLKTMVGVLVVLGTSFFGLVAYAASLSTVEDLAEHNVSVEAHPIMLDTDGDGPKKPEKKYLAKVVMENTEAITKVGKTASRAEAAAINVQNGFFDQRSESFAQQAVTKLPENMKTKHKIKKYEDYKSRARKNLETNKPVHHGMEDLAF